MEMLVVPTKIRCEQCNEYFLEDFGKYLYCWGCKISYPKEMKKEEFPWEGEKEINIAADWTGEKTAVILQGSKVCFVCNGRYGGTWAEHKGECRK